MLETILETLRAREPLPPLVSRHVWQPELSHQIQTTSDGELFGPVQNSTTAQLCRAGLLLWNDDLDASHSLSQRCEGDQSADYWHAIMHRREGDEGNARYWWRRVGQHPAFGEVSDAVLTVMRAETAPNEAASSFISLLERAGPWLPIEFTALCARASGDDTWLRRVQAVEMETFLKWYWRRR